MVFAANGARVFQLYIAQRWPFKGVITERNARSKTGVNLQRLNLPRLNLQRLNLQRLNRDHRHRRNKVHACP